MGKGNAIRQWAFAAALLATCAARAGAQATDKPAVRVNGEAILESEIQAVLEARPSPVPLSKELQVEMRKAAIEALVDDLVMRQFLHKAVAPVDPADVQKELDKLAEALKKQMPPKTMEQFLKEGKMTAETLRTDVSARLQWKAYLRGKYSEAEARSYYTANKLFFDNVTVRASHILVKVAPSAPAEEKQRARAKLETIRQEIVAGKISFDEAARKYSDCPSKKEGGDLGNFPYKFIVVEPVAQAAFAKQKGEMTDIVTSDFGYHVLKITDRTPGEQSQFELIPDVVRDVMAQDAELFQRILNEQKKAAKVEVLPI